ncbi:MAG: DAK2 domain-containing protein, partial [bacterium]
MANTLTIDTDKFRLMLRNAARNVALHKDMVDRMNVFPVPDGDTGTNMTYTLQKMESMLSPEAGTPRQLAMDAAHGALLGARGNSGVILSQILRGLAESLSSSIDVSGVEFAYSLVAASDCAYQAVIKPVEGTILTVAKDAATSAIIRATEVGATMEDILDSAVHQARVTLARTPQMLDKLRQAGVVDAGGQGFVFFLEGMLSALLGEVLHEKETVKTPQLAETEHLPFLYCTELTL